MTDLRVTENSGNTTSSDPTTLPITITCGPVQRTRSLPVKRQDQGGPSGSLNTPSGGTQYTSPDDAIRVAYTPVTEGGQTFAIDGALTSESANYTVSLGPKDHVLLSHRRRSSQNCVSLPRFSTICFLGGGE